ncbi:MAG: hypothetical protein PHX30_05895 [Candidatus Pacebacteria bacterium]|nr:hypothetical protein [Candidatus Paceibacterota bacterium]
MITIILYLLAVVSYLSKIIAIAILVAITLSIAEALLWIIHQGSRIIKQTGIKIAARLLKRDIENEFEDRENFVLCLKEKSTLSFWQKIIFFASGPIAQILYGMFVLFLCGIAKGQEILTSIIFAFFITVMAMRFLVMGFFQIIQSMTALYQLISSFNLGSLSSLYGISLPAIEADLTWMKLSEATLLMIGILSLLGGIANLLPVSGSEGGQITEELLKIAALGEKKRK